MRSFAFLLLLCLGLACTSEPGASPGAGPEPPIHDPNGPPPVRAVPKVALKPLPKPIDIDAQLEKWAPFFAKRFGGEPADAKAGDLNGDGKPELVVQTQRTFLHFDDLTVAEPKSWTSWGLHPQEAPMRIVGRRFLVGTRAPIEVTWSKRDKDHVFSQAIPLGLEDATSRAKKKHPQAFAPGLKWQLGDSIAVFEGEKDLSQHFYGDFDADGALELAVLVPGALELWESAGAPVSTTIDYPARKAMVHLGGRKLNAVNDTDVQAQPVDVKGDWIDLWMPEKSSQARYFKDGAWREVWTSD